MRQRGMREEEDSLRQKQQGDAGADKSATKMPVMCCGLTHLGTRSACLFARM